MKRDPSLSLLAFGLIFCFFFLALRVLTNTEITDKLSLSALKYAVLVSWLGAAIGFYFLLSTTWKK